MTLQLDLDLNILKVYPNTKNEVSRSRYSKVKSPNQQTETQAHNQKHYHHAHSRVATIPLDVTQHYVGYFILNERSYLLNAATSNDQQSFAKFQPSQV